MAENRPRPPSPERARRLRVWAVALAALLVAAASFAVGFHFGDRHGRAVVAGEERAHLLEKLERQRRENARLRRELERARALAKNAPVRAFGEDQLLFFEELPNEPVEPPPIPSPGAPAAPERDDIARVIAAHVQPHDAYAQSADAAPARPAAAAPNPAPAASAGPGGGWAVQAASFRSEADAEHLRARIAKAGTPAFVRRVDLGARGIWWRVYAGPFAARIQAENARERLYHALGLRGFVARAPAR